MRTLTLDFPDSIDIEKEEALLIISSKLFEQGKLSLGQAATLAGLSKRNYLELLNKFNVSIFGQTNEELLKDIQNA